MFANAFSQEVRHLEMRIAEQGRYAHDRRKHLCKESPATVAYEQVWLLLVDKHAYVFQCFLGMERQIGSQHDGLPIKGFLSALAIGQLPVAKKPCRNSIFFMLFILCLVDCQICPFS